MKPHSGIKRFKHQLQNKSVNFNGKFLKIKKI